MRVIGMERHPLIKKMRNALFFLRFYGFRLFVKEVFKTILDRPWLSSARRYSLWIEQNEPSGEDLLRQKKFNFTHRPIISIVVTVHNTPAFFLKEMLASVLNQTYPNWELCIDGGGSSPETQEILTEYEGRDPRIKVKLLGENKGVAGNSNEALSLAAGDYIAFLEVGDTLAPFALFDITRTINEKPGADIIYSDEDLISEDGKLRSEPHFKPDWSPDNLRSFNYISRLTVIKKEVLLKSGWFREGFEGGQEYDLILRATESARNIVHLPKVLYHRRLSKNAWAERPDVKLCAYDAGIKALAGHLLRTRLEGTVEDGASQGLYKISYLISNPKISIIIPNRDHAEDLNNCIKSILDKSTYKNYEIIIVENGSVEDKTVRLYDALGRASNIKIIKWEGPFNYSSVNNHAVRIADGDFMLFLNNDTEVISNDWLEKMLEHGERKDVGVVGAKLYYPDHTIQHAGIVLRADGQVLHSFRFFPHDAFGYRARLKITQDVSAVTGACMMVRKQVFEEVEGFDEGYEISFGDIDLCMKVREKRYLVLWTPYAELYHHELKTRGYDNTPEKKERVKIEEELFRARWKNVLEKGDPYYSPNLTQNKEDFSIKIS